MNGSDRKGQQFIVHGRVQGVGFRWFVQRTATELGLSGWVRNEPDGTVRVEARGDGPQLQELSGQLSTGPPGSSVERVDALDATNQTTEGTFRILR